MKAWPQHHLESGSSLRLTFPEWAEGWTQRGPGVGSRGAESAGREHGMYKPVRLRNSTSSPPQCQDAQQHSWRSRLLSSLGGQRCTNLSLCFCITSWFLSCLCFSTLCSWNCWLFGGMYSVDGLVVSLGYRVLYCSQIYSLCVYISYKHIIYTHTLIYTHYI